MTRLLAALLALTLFFATTFASGHDHQTHDRACAVCVVAGAHAVATPPPRLPRPHVAVAVATLELPRGEGHGLPPLSSAPKHGPPAPSFA